MRTLEVDLDAIAANFRTIRDWVGGAEVLAVVKADAYGHGMTEVAARLEREGAVWFGVADITEALRLRASGISAEILCWIHGQSADFRSALEANITVGISNEAQLAGLVRAATDLGKPAKLHIKLDSGLGRNGCGQAEWPALIEAVKRAQERGLIETPGVFSHLSGTSREDDLAQLERFNGMLETASASGLQLGTRHLAASAAALWLPEARLDMVRVGIALYGLDPLSRGSVLEPRLRPAMTVASEVVQLKRVPAGEGVSYGYLYRTEVETTLALVPIGYAEGLPRVATGQAEAWLGGKRYPIMARIAMDQFVLDVGDDAVRLGDRVVLFGPGDDGEPTATELAAVAETINYEIVTRMGGRLERSYRGASR